MFPERDVDVLPQFCISVFGREDEADDMHNYRTREITIDYYRVGTT